MVPLVARVLSGRKIWYATEAANEAPSILPKLETWRDLGKKPVSAADAKAMIARMDQRIGMIVEGLTPRP